MIIRNLIIIILCCGAFFSQINAEESLGGLLFTSSKEKVDKRTSLVLFGDKLQRYQDKFTISFDLSIWDSDQFGHIFRVINDKKQEIEFVFVNFYGTDNMYLDFHSPITHRSVQIPITREDIDKKANLHFDLTFDLKADRASIVLRDSSYVCEPIGLENPSNLQFAFGMYGLNLDVLQMLIKNLRISTGRGKIYHFPLDESEGTLAYDTTRTVAAVVKNPQWIINENYCWKAKAAFTFDDKVRVKYLEKGNQILIFDNDSVSCFEPRYNKVSRYKFEPDFNSSDTEDETLYLHHNNFLSSSDELYRFGGYSNYSYSNKISVYNKGMNRWETLDFKGDNITPRFHSAVGDGVKEDEILIFGGFGNETGRQEHGGHNLYDLHQLDLKQRTISHLWTLNITGTEFIPSNNLILSTDKTAFYALCYPHHLPKTMGCLYRFDLKTGNYEVVSDSVPFVSEGMSTSVNLFYNRELCEFYAVIRDLTEKDENRVQIYSLRSPPVTKARLEQTFHSQKPLLKIVLLAIILIVFLLGVYIVWRFILGKNKKLDENRLANTVDSPHQNGSDQKRQIMSAVYVFGNFTVYDRKGVDITYRFSMKLMTLFSLVLLNTKGQSGLSTKGMSLALWPDKDVDEAKSIRGVTVNRLRSILDDIDGIQLVHQKRQWFFVFEPPFYCDWLNYSGILRNLPVADPRKDYKALMEQFISIISNGTFLANVQDIELDIYKSKVKEKQSQLLKDYIVCLYEDKQYDKIASISPTLSIIDSLDEKTLNIFIQAYNKMDKNEEAKEFLKSYKQIHNKNQKNGKG